MTKAAVRPKTAAKVSGKLTEKEALFIEHYLGAAAGNGRKAAEMAGYGGKPDTLKKVAWNILKRPRVIEVMAEAREARSTTLVYAADDVLRELLQLLADAKALPKNSLRVRTVLAVLDKIGAHVAVNAFRQQVGLSNPAGGPIDVNHSIDLTGLTDDELEYVERAREAIDRANGGNPVPDSDPSGEATEVQATGGE